MKTNKYILWGMTKSTLIHIFLMSVAIHLPVSHILDGALCFYDQ